MLPEQAAQQLVPVQGDGTSWQIVVTRVGWFAGLQRVLRSAMSRGLGLAPISMGDHFPRTRRFLAKWCGPTVIINEIAWEQFYQ